MHWPSLKTKSNVYKREMEYLFYESLPFHSYFPDNSFKQDHAGKFRWKPILYTHSPNLTRFRDQKIGMCLSNASSDSYYIIFIFLTSQSSGRTFSSSCLLSCNHASAVNTSICLFARTCKGFSPKNRCVMIGGFEVGK